MEKNQNGQYDDEINKQTDEISSLDDLLSKRILQKKADEEALSTSMNEEIVHEELAAQPMKDSSQQPNFTLIDTQETVEPKHDKEDMQATIQAQAKSDEHNPKDKQEKKQKTRSFYQRYRSPILLSSCILIGGVSGIGGSYLYSSLNASAGGNTVLYQNVQRTDADGTAITNMSVKDVVSNTTNSVVEITTESVSNDQFMQQAVTEGAGSGVIVTKDGYIVTNNHVVEGASKISVRTKDGTSYEAKLIGTDAKTDLAVIKIEATDLQAAIMGSSSVLSVGDMAIAIGNPLGQLGGTVTQGIISALDREITIDGQAMTLLQTDTAINPGNSGGGLFDEGGNLIGIVNAKTSGSSVEGLGFAIPIDTAKKVIESIITSGYVTGRPQLGVGMVNVESETAAFQAGVNELGVYVSQVTADSAADKAGLKVRDRILKVDGEEITSSSDISKIVDSKEVGDTITLTIERDGSEKTITATLQEAKQTTENSSNSSQNSSKGSFSR